MRLHGDAGEFSVTGCDGMVKVQQELGPEAVVCAVLCDDNKKYLSTDLWRPEPLREGYLSPHIELLGFESIDCPALEEPMPI